MVLRDRRFLHARDTHRAQVGASLRVGLLDGNQGTGLVTRMEPDLLEMEVELLQAPPPKLPLILVMALPRPKALNRVLASATSLGAAQIHLINAWKVEKSYWKSPRLEPANLLHQRVLGLEQAKDTVLPTLHLHRLFRPFAEEVLPSLMADRLALVAHPGAWEPCLRQVTVPVTLALGPEGGWTDPEMQTLIARGVRPVALGPRILRTETAVAALVGRLF